MREVLHRLSWAKRSLANAPQPTHQTPAAPSQDASRVFWRVGVPFTVRAVPTTQQLFVAPPSPHDVQQRGFNSCHVLAPAQAALAQDASLLSRVFQTCDDGINVRYFEACDAQLQTFAERFTRVSLTRHKFHLCGIALQPLSAQSHDTQTPLWPALLEDAFAQTHGGYPSLMRHADPVHAMRWLTGKPCKTKKPEPHVSHNERLALVAQAFVAGRCIVLHSPTHGYAVIGANVNANGDASVTILNPAKNARPRQHVLKTSDIKPPFRIAAYTMTLE